MDQMAAAVCEMERLPDELLTEIISLTSPRDACSTACVSRGFRAAADSDAAWSRFLPRGLPRLAGGEEVSCQLQQPSTSKKRLFMRLSDSDHPALLPGGLMSMWMNRVTGAKCYTLSARALNISWQDHPYYWRWIHLPSDDFIIAKRFTEAAQLWHVTWLEIRGKIRSKMLSQGCSYAAYLVFKLADVFCGLDFPFQEVTTSVVGESVSKTARRVCIQGYDEEEDAVVAGEIMPRRRYVLESTTEGMPPHPPDFVIPLEDDVALPRRRSDGWMELEMGEFYNEGGFDGEISVRLLEHKVGKTGLIVWGIEFRAK